MVSGPATGCANVRRRCTFARILGWARPWTPPPVPWRALLTVIGLLCLLFGVLFYLALREGPLTRG